MRLTLGLLWEAFYTIDGDLTGWEMRRIEFNSAADAYLKCRKENGDEPQYPGGNSGMKLRLTPEDADSLLIDSANITPEKIKKISQMLVKAGKELEEDADRLASAARRRLEKTKG